jgi:hypothetical protein
VIFVLGTHHLYCILQLLGGNILPVVAVVEAVRYWVAEAVGVTVILVVVVPEFVALPIVLRVL